MVPRGYDLVDSAKVRKKFWENAVELTFKLRLKIFTFELFLRQIDFDLDLALNVEVHSDEMVQRHTLSQGLIKLEKADHSDTVWLWQ